MKNVKEMLQAALRGAVASQLSDWPTWQFAF